MSPTLLLAAIAIRGIVLYPDSGGRGQACPITPELAYTAAHVMEDVPTGRWETALGGGPVRVLTIDTKTDIAIVRAEGGARFPWWHVVAQGQPEVGTTLYATGWRIWARDWYMTRGLYYGLDEENEMSMEMPVHFGMSGGCVLNERDEAVGVVRGMIDDHHSVWGVSYAQPIWRMEKKSKEVK